MKITTEIQRNLKLLHLSNEKKKLQFHAKIGRGYTGGRSRERKNNAGF